MIGNNAVVGDAFVQYNRILVYNVPYAGDQKSWRKYVTGRHLALGETLTVSFSVVSESTCAQQLVIDYAIHYRKANGVTSRKVFKLKELRLEAGASANITKRQRIVDFSTRKHYAGEHGLEVMVNGHRRAYTEFEIQC